MTDSSQHHDPPLEPYLDGLLDDAARQDFGKQIEQRDDLREQVQLQKAIDRSMKQHFECVPVNGRMTRIEQAAAGRGQSASMETDHSNQSGESRFQQLATMELKPRHLAIAAMLIVAVGLGWWFLRDQFQPEPPAGGIPYMMSSYPVGPPQAVDDYIVEQISGKFEPAWECPPALFASLILQRFGDSLVMAEIPPDGVEPLGVSYCNTVTPQTMCMLFIIDDRRVIVFFDLKSKVDAAHINVPVGLNMFRQDIGGLSMIEFTPFDGPRAMKMFTESEAPMCRP